MKSALLQELSYLFRTEADNVNGAPYAWPPAPPPSDEQLAEQDRLYAIADELGKRATNQSKRARRAHV